MLRQVFVALVSALVFVFLLRQTPMVYPEELNAGLENEALSIITDVIGLDLTKYDAKLYKHNMVSFDNNSPVQESISYILEADESKIRVSLAFINQTLIRWGLSPFNSSQLSPIYSQPLPTNKIEAARDVLERYQAYSKSPIIQEARSILDTVTETETMNITVGNLKMRIIEDENRFSIDWVRIVNGLEFGTGLSVRVRNGVVDLFGDRSSFFYIGSADVNISQEEAVRIAWEEAKNCTTVRIWRGDSYETFPFHLVEEHRTVQLYVGSTKDFGLYTYWKVWFAADPEVYSTTGFEVSLRADTGEISYSQLTGYMGSFNGAEAPDSEASSETQREGNLNPPLAAYVFAATASIITIIAIIMLAFKKEEKSPPAPLPQNM